MTGRGSPESEVRVVGAIGEPKREILIPTPDEAFPPVRMPEPEPAAPAESPGAPVPAPGVPVPAGA
jgi:hypothetical protein